MTLPCAQHEAAAAAWQSRLFGHEKSREKVSPGLVEVDAD
jgi:hypothetical protein